MRIVPRTRLIGWVGFVVVPLATFMGIPSPAAVYASILLAAFVLVSVLDALRSLRLLDGVTVELPAIVRLTKGKEGTVDVRFTNATDRESLVRVALPFPREIRSRFDEQELLLPRGPQRARLAWPCHPIERGQFVLHSFYLETHSPFGLWDVRSAVRAQCDIRVYPNIWNERDAVGALFLKRSTAGIHAQRQIGKGREFEKLREYAPGDDFGDIHWKTTAKRGRPVTKVFQIERTQEIYVAIDSSRLSARRFGDTEPVPALDGFVTSSLLLALAAESQGDLFGLVTFSDRVDRFLRAAGGKVHFQTCRESLFTLQPRAVTPDFAEIFTFFRTRVRRRALMIVLTHLDDPLLAESFVQQVDLVGRHHVVLVNMLKPAETRPLFSDDSVQTIDEIYEHLAGHHRWQKLRELQGVLRRRGVMFSALENENLSAQLVAQYITIKRRQIL